MMKASFAIIEKRELFRKGICRLLAQDTWISVLYETGSLAEGMSIVSELQPNVLLIDPFFDRPNAPEITCIKELSPLTKIVVVTDSDQPEDLVTAAKGGVRGYFLKSTPFTEFEAGLYTVACGGYGATQSLSAMLFRQLSRQENPNVLTSRESEIYDLLKSGFSNREIAEMLHVSIYTVKNHVSSIMKKYDLKTRYQIIPAYKADNNKED